MLPIAKSSFETSRKSNPLPPYTCLDYQLLYFHYHLYLLSSCCRGMKFLSIKIIVFIPVCGVSLPSATSTHHPEVTVESCIFSMQSFDVVCPQYCSSCCCSDIFYNRQYQTSTCYNALYSIEKYRPHIGPI